MSNVAVPEVSGTVEPSDARPQPAHRGSALPLGFDQPYPPDRSLPHDCLEAADTKTAACATLPSTPTPSTPPDLPSESDREMIDYLIKKAIEKCIPFIQGS